MTSRSFGVGFRSPHYSYVLENRPHSVDWFEVISENFMDTAGQPLRNLLEVRKHYPVALHGVGLSVASPDGGDRNYLTKLKALIGKVDPFIVSDHFCFTGLNGVNSHDLLPFPYNDKTLAKVVENISEAQEFLGRQLLFENPSVYLTYRDSTMTEVQFMIEACRRAGAGMLLDLNNVNVNATNFGFKAKDYISSIPNDLIGQIHIAGASTEDKFVFDTHDHPVSPPVWSLLKQISQLCPDVPVLLEWDDRIPPFNELADELSKARKILADAFAAEPVAHAKS